MCAHCPRHVTWAIRIIILLYSVSFLNSLIVNVSFPLQSAHSDYCMRCQSESIARTFESQIPIHIKTFIRYCDASSDVPYCQCCCRYREGHVIWIRLCLVGRENLCGAIQLKSEHSLRCGIVITAYMLLFVSVAHAIVSSTHKHNSVQNRIAHELLNTLKIFSDVLHNRESV